MSAPNSRYTFLWSRLTLLYFKVSFTGCQHYALQQQSLGIAVGLLGQMRVTAYPCLLLTLRTGQVCVRLCVFVSVCVRFQTLLGCTCGDA